MMVEATSCEVIIFPTCFYFSVGTFIPFSETMLSSCSEVAIPSSSFSPLFVKILIIDMLMCFCCS